MSSATPALIHPAGSLRTTLVGWVAAAVLTGIAFAVVAGHVLPEPAAMLVAAALALAQVGVHLICFLHIGAGRHGRMRLVGVVWIVTVVAILLGGTLWIMANLNTRTMEQQMQYMNQQSGV